MRNTLGGIKIEGAVLRRRMATTCVLILLVLLAGFVLDHFLDNIAPITLATVACALITFFAFAGSLGERAAHRSDEAIIRRAIAASIVVEYLVLVGLVAFWANAPEKMPPITQTLITNFTSVVGIVVAFYFGASAYVEASAKRVDEPGSETESASA